MYMAFAYASFDGDDAYYVVQSVLADQTGVLNRIRPYTGLSTDLDIRHALATLPLWIAYVARMTGIHATIVAHTLLPLIFIPLTYYVFVQIGRKLFSDGSVKLPIFLTLVSIMQIWGIFRSIRMKPFPDADLAGKISAGKPDLAGGAVADVGALCAGKKIGRGRKKRDRSCPTGCCLQSIISQRR